VATTQEADHQKADLSAGTGRDLQQGRIPPERLGGEEVDAVLAQVGLALGRIEFKNHYLLNLYLFDPSRASFQAGRPPSGSTTKPAIQS
jgi:hypothetical protein